MIGAFRSVCRSKVCTCIVEYIGQYCESKSVCCLSVDVVNKSFVETSVNVISNSPSQDYTHPDDRTSLNYDMTPGFKPFTIWFCYSYYYAAVKTICMLYSYRNTGRQGVTCAPASETRVKR